MDKGIYSKYRRRRTEWMLSIKFFGGDGGSGCGGGWGVGGGVQWSGGLSIGDVFWWVGEL